MLTLKNNGKNILIYSAISLGVAGVIIAGVVFYFYSLKIPEKSVPQAEITPSDIHLNSGSLVETVGKLINLPEGEKPTVATVTDLNKLKSQSFFANAAVGDKVLVYFQAKKAYLYRPSTNKLIDIGPVSSVDQSNLTSVAGEATVSASSKAETTKQFPLTKIAIYNGTKIPRLAAKAEAEVSSYDQNFKVIQKGNTINEYQQSVIILLNPDVKDSADELSNQMNISVQPMPEGENAPKNADLLIITGSEYSGS